MKQKKKSLHTRLDKLKFRQSIIDRLKKLKITTVGEFLARPKMEILEEGFPHGVYEFVRRRLFTLGFATSCTSNELTMPDGTSDLDGFIRKNKGLVHDFLNRTSYLNMFGNGRLDPMLDEADIIQDMFEGMIDAVHGYDETRGSGFGSYVWFWFRQKIFHRLLRLGTVKFPIKLRRMVKHYQDTKAELEKELGREASSEEIRQALRMSKRRYSELEAVIHHPNYRGSIESLESTRSRPDDTTMLLGNTIEISERYEGLLPPTVLLDKLDARRFVESLLDHPGLTVRSRYILIHRFGLKGERPKTLDEMGALLNLTRERTRQLQVKAIEHLQRVYTPHDEP